MPIVIDANMKIFADRLNISSSRMIQDYGLKTVDQIIEAEAAQGNTAAVNYARDMYNSPEKLIKIFKLTDVENKFVLLHNMDDKTRRAVIPLLEKEDLVMGLYFFTQDKLLEILQDVDIEELVNVILEAFPLEAIVMMFKEEDLAKFFQNDKLDRYIIMNELTSMPPDVTMKFIEGLTGKPYSHEQANNIFENLAALSDDKFREFMTMIDPDVQRQVTFQITKQKPKYLQLFENQAYVDMLATLMKPEMVKPMIALEQETLSEIIELLPDDFMSIVCAQVDTKKFAEFLIDGHMDVIEQALMV